MRHLIGVLGACAILSACTGGGPRVDAILNSENATRIEADTAEPYVLVALNQDVADQASAALAASQSKSFLPKARQKPIVIGSGDILDITIVSTSENGFIDFSQSAVSPVSTTPLPPQEVGSDGNVNVPPIGRVNARGQSVQQFERFLTRRLGEVLVDPSVIVTLAERRSAKVSILGRVANPGSYSIGQDSMHLLDVLGQAGGPTLRADKLEVAVSRRGTSARVPLDALYTNPRFNIHVMKDDVISIEPFLTRVSILGGTSTNAILEFDDPKVTLADTLSRAGGLLNRRADRKGIFIYRKMAKTAVKKLGADTDKFDGSHVATIFQLDLSAPTSLFAAGAFRMQTGDVVYVADSLNEEINAIFSSVTTFVPAPAEFVRAETVPLQQ